MRGAGATPPAGRRGRGRLPAGGGPPRLPATATLPGSGHHGRVSDLDQRFRAAGADERRAAPLGAAARGAARAAAHHHVPPARRGGVHVHGHHRPATAQGGAGLRGGGSARAPRAPVEGDVRDCSPPGHQVPACIGVSRPAEPGHHHLGVRHRMCRPQVPQRAQAAPPDVGVHGVHALPDLQGLRAAGHHLQPGRAADGRRGGRGAQPRPAAAAGGGPAALHVHCAHHLEGALLRQR
mmetsp:Transcript_9061/g.23351  ORF Transcript_9061/g.23351 Transcript_9061/m.23351 type:complete len:237 (-) Transcript_9061:245-955(-)